MTVNAPLPSYRAVLQPDWMDYNGHLRDAYYGLVLSYAIDDVMDALGLDADYRAATRCTLYTVEQHMHFTHEVKATDDLSVTTCILDADRKRIHAGCRFQMSRVAGAVATAEILLLHVHQGAKPASAAFPPEVERRLEDLRVPVAARDAWQPASRKIELKRRSGP
jgi:acyl-CoA thioester hydrolase